MLTKQARKFAAFTANPPVEVFSAAITALETHEAVFSCNALMFEVDTRLRGEVVGIDQLKTMRLAVNQFLDAYHDHTHAVFPDCTAWWEHPDHDGSYIPARVAAIKSFAATFGHNL